jgi:hypothetical protein
MPSKNLTSLSFSTFLFLVSQGVVAATTATAFFGTGFLLLTHPREEIKPAATTADQPAPAETTAATADQPAPTDDYSGPASRRRRPRRATSPRRPTRP